MRDLELWRALKGPADDELLPPLEELATLPLEQRMPFLSPLIPLLESENSELRRVAAKCLSGATGWSGLTALLQACEDESPEVVSQALTSLECSVSGDPARWAHAVFHHRPLVRHLACEHRPRWPHLNLFLLDDPQCAVRVQENFPAEVPEPFGPAILGWLKAGRLPPTLARAVLKVKHMAHLFTQPNSADDLQAMVKLFWDDEPEAVHFWRDLEAWLCRRDNAYRKSTFGIWMRQVSRWLEVEHWPDSVCHCLFAIDPVCLLELDNPPLQARRVGLKVLYRRDGLSVEPDQLLRLLEGDLVLRKDGSYDLWALGAVLTLSPDPQMVLSSLPFDELVSSARRAPEDVPFLFLASGSVASRQVNFAHRLGQEAGCQVPVAAGLLAGPLGFDQVKKQLSKVSPLELTATLLELEQREGFRLSDSREDRITTGLSKLLAGQFAIALPLLLDKFSSGPGLSVSLLSELSRGVEPKEFVAVSKALSIAQLKQFLKAIDDCAGFHYPSEGLLAQEFESSPDPEVAEWCQRRRHRPAPELVRPSSYQVRALTQPEASLIVTSPAGGLANALRPALEAPTLGLVEPLKKRTARFSVEAVLALVGCHDELDQVAALLTDYSEGRLLEKEVVAHWSYQPELPLHGHCWLHRFDFHIDRADQWVGRSSSQLEGLVERASRLRFPVSGCVWKMIARLFSRWWCREPQRLSDLLTPSILDRLVEGLQTVHQEEAAICLLRMWQTGTMGQALVDLKPRLLAMLCDLEKGTRDYLAGFVNSRGVPGPTRRRRTGDAQPDLLASVRSCDDLAQLKDYALDRHGDVVAEAVLRLLDFGESGADVLMELLLRPSSDASAPHHAPLLAEWIGLWPEGKSRGVALERVRQRGFEPEVLFAAALSLLENGEATLDSALWAARQPIAMPWFIQDCWSRLVRCGASPQRLALELAESPHPHAYMQAVEYARESGLEEALVLFLECDHARQHSLRLEVARELWEQGDRRGFPLLFGEQMSTDTPYYGLLEGDLVAGVESVLLAGQPCVPETVLVKWMLALPEDTFEELATLVLKQSRRKITCQALLSRLPHTARRRGLLSRLAGIFLWGIKVGRQLTSRLFQIEMLGGEDLGYTRMEESRIFINPLPLFRGQQYGQEVVEGLILHELGHHVYHRGEEEKQTWQKASEEGIFSLLNLVSDEHLERNLRSMDPMYDRCLKRLAAFAFLHNRREVPVDKLLETLQFRAFAVLSNSKLEVARKAGRVGLRSGELFSSLEKEGESSFGRFVRALRMGRGNRWGDEKVKQALKLFGSGFRDLKLADQLPIARELRKIFGQECELIKVLSQDGACEADPEEVLVLGEGLTPEEMRRELERLQRDSGSSSQEGPPVYWLNKCADPTFPPLTQLVPVAFDAAVEREYVRQVARHARRLSQVFQQLGLTYQPQRYRIRGHRVDSARVSQAVLRGEVRILQSRQLRFKTDLFLGVLVDCSGSMQGESIHKARLFATLVAQAARGLKGLDLRVLGFNDTTLFDAGDAHRCAAHNLQVSGGNNDAGALAYAATLARASRRRARLLVMISDGLPTACSVDALRGVVEKLSRKERICCAQVAVRPLKEVCFPHYIELQGDGQLGLQVAEFGRIIARLTYKTLR